MRKQWLFLIVVLLTSLTLWGCGSSRDSSDVGGTPPVDIGDAELTGNCTVCHTLSVHTFVDGIAGVNPDPVGLGTAITHDCEACHGGGQFHHGTGPIPFPSPDGARCETCHAQATLVLASKHNTENETNVAMLADGHDDGYCQRCHTAEGFRSAINITGEASDIENGIVDYGVTPGPGQVEALPHLLDMSMVGNEAYEDDPANHILHNVVCATCHNPLTKELVTAGWDPNQNGAADQYDLCTSCHSLEMENGDIFGSGEVVDYGNGITLDTAEFYHANSWYRNITATHFDNPLTLSGQGNENGTTIINKVEGYVIRKDSANPCFDCHGHELFTNTRRAGNPAYEQSNHTDWAQSNHGGKILTQVLEDVALIDCTGSPSLSRGKCNEQTNAAMVAYTSDSTTPAWTHYDWDATYKADGTDADTIPDSDRGDCQMCHTATGVSNFLNDPVAYDPVNNDFSHLEGWVGTPGTISITTGSPQNEMLYCWGCHSDAESGALRNPGAIPRPYTVGGVAVDIPDVGNSNVCINCHGARGNAESYGLTGDPADITIAAFNPGFGATGKNVTEAHYLTAAATLYAADTKIGYEYAGQNYAPVGFFAHDGIGLNGDSPETGSGPCAACHMETAAQHKFEVVEKDATGTITALLSTACIECHTGAHGPGLVVTDTTTANGLQTAAAAAAFLQEEAEGYHETLEILNQALIGRGLTFQTNYPYFSGASWVNEGIFGAAHNYNYLHHEPGAYAHNRYYAKRLLFDSIDWVDNDTLDGVINIDASVYPEAALWLGAATVADPTATPPVLVGDTTRP